RLMYLRRAHHVAVKDNAVGDRRRRNADMVQAAQFHIALAIHPIVTAIPISTNNAPNKATKRLKLHARAKRNGLSSRRTMKLMPLSIMPASAQLFANSHPLFAMNDAPSVQATEMAAHIHSIIPS